MNYFSGRKIQLIIIAAAIFLAFSNIFGNGFTLDDSTFFGNWQGAQSIGNIFSLLAGDLPAGHEGVYRPVSTIMLSLYRTIGGDNIALFHLFALFFHLLIAVLIYLLIEKITDKQSLAFAGGLLFGLHPVHIESITYMTGSGGLWAAALFFAAFYFYINRKKDRFGDTNYLCSILLASLSYFAYEVTFVLPVLLMFYDFCFKSVSWAKFIKRGKLYLPFWGGLFFYLILRVVLTKSGGLRGEYIAGDFFVSLLVTLKTWVMYLQLLVFPIGQAYNHSLPGGAEAILYRGYNKSAFLSLQWWDPDVLLSVLIIFGLGFVSWRFLRKFPVLYFGMGWVLIGLVPVANLIPQWSAIHERFLYIPSFGFILLVAGTLGYLNSLKMKNLMWGIILVLSIFYGGLTYLRNQDWKNNIALWSKDVSVYPKNNAYAYFQRGEAYFQQGDKEKALTDYQKAFEINPSFAVAIASAARTYAEAGKEDLAIENYQKAVQTDANFWEGYYNLGNIYLKQGKQDLANSYFQQAAKINPALGLVENREMIQYSSSGLSFSYPLGWVVSSKNQELSIKNQEGDFEIEMTVESRGKNQSINNYLKAQTITYGILVNQGLAQIPNTDFAYVKVWNESGVNKMEFFLFKSDKVIKILVYPSDSDLMKEFDRVVQTISF